MKQSEVCIECTQRNAPIHNISESSALVHQPLVIRTGLKAGITMDQYNGLTPQEQATYHQSLQNARTVIAGLGHVGSLSAANSHLLARAEQFLMNSPLG